VLLLGVDGCRGGWAVAERDGAYVELHLERDFEGVLARAGRRGVVAVDMPIGLSDAAPRACDVEARRLLGPGRASSVFPAPARAVLGATTYATACAASVAACGRALSLQTFHLLARIREVDGAVTPALQRRVREVHPELVFAALAGGRGLGAGKRTREGHEARRALLEAALGPVPDLALARRRLGPTDVGLDDLADALACLVAAARIAGGRERRVPAGPARRDRRGLAMEICY
jgi:predicted RNase H-like nuclease